MHFSEASAASAAAAVHADPIAGKDRLISEYRLSGNGA
jgi:hypothetical protein